MIKEKLQKITNLVNDRDLDAIIISQVPNIEYLLENYLETPTVLIRVNKDGTYMIYTSKLDRDRILDFTDVDQSCVRTFSALPEEGEINFRDLYKIVVEGCKKIGVDSLELYDKMSRKISDINIVKVIDDIEKIRSVKSDREIGLVKESIRIAEKCLEEALLKVKPGIREIDVEALLTKSAIEHECTLAFKPIVASGPNSAYPHHISTRRRIERGDVVVIDFGVRYRCYCSDITRTLVVGSPSQEIKNMIEAVAEAHIEAASKVKVGAYTSDVDRVAREVLKKYGLDKYFIHSLGHGIGVECHERPSISPISEEKFESGNIITIEPGIYFRGRFGIRIEDDYLVTESGIQRLTSIPQLLV